MYYRALELLGDLGVEVLYRLSLMRSSHDLLTVIQFSWRITYGGHFCSSGVIDSCSKVSVIGDAAVFNIGNIGIGILLTVPRFGISLW